MTAEITMTLPAESRFVATIRVTSASLAAELDFAMDRIEELRVGVNELAAVLMEWAHDHGADQIRLTYTVADGELAVVGEVVGSEDATSQAGDLDDLTRQILASVTDEFEVTGGKGRILKRRDPE